MRPERILVIDDDRDLVDLIAARCRELGYQVDTARNSLAAVISMIRRQPDLILLDVNMPTGNGLDLCHYLAHESNVPTKPVIIMSGQNNPATIRRCAELRACYLRKSTDFWPELRAEIEKVLPPPAKSACAAPH